MCEIDLNGGAEKRILFHRNHDSQPSVSPDGTGIAFVAISDGNSEIYVMNRDGSGLQRLTHVVAEDTSPNWSPDGRRLVFVSDRGGRSAIYEIDV
jgi:TolB protein